MKNLGVLLVIGIGIWLLTKLKAGMSLQFVPRGVSFSGSGLVVQLGVVNSSAFPLSFNSFSGYLLVNNQPVGIVNDFSPQQIAPNAETPLVFNFTPNLGVLVTDIINFVKNGGSSVVSLQGNANIENVNIPINQSLTVAGI